MVLELAFRGFLSFNGLKNPERSRRSEMRRLTIMRASGDPDDLLAAKREHIDPVIERRAGEFGNIFHVAARTSDGMMVLNLWESAEGSEQAAQDPEIQAAREAMAQSGAAEGPPQVEHYEVEDFRQPAEG